MTREELLARLRDFGEDGPGITYADGRFRDKEAEHIAADEALLEFINDPEVTQAFNDIEKWYA